MPNVFSSGSSVSVVGNKVIINGKVLSGDSFEDLPVVDETIEKIREIEINGDDVSLEPGEVFQAKGNGYLRKVFGSKVIVENFTGTLVIPSNTQIEIKVNAGSVRGQANDQQSVELKSNAGDINLRLLNRERPVNIEAKANAGNIIISVI
jgi:hypothetical protein